MSISNNFNSIIIVNDILKKMKSLFTSHVGYKQQECRILLPFIFL